LGFRKSFSVYKQKEKRDCFDRLDLLLELLQTYGYEIVPLQEIKQ